LHGWAPPGTHGRAFGFQRDDDGRGFLVHGVQVLERRRHESGVLVGSSVGHGDIDLQTPLNRRAFLGSVWYQTELRVRRRRSVRAERDDGIDA
jgi:hypothetical protein